MSPHEWLLLVALAAGPAPAAPPAPPAQAPARPAAAPKHSRHSTREPRDSWSLSDSLGRQYDDNVIQLTEADKALFERRPGPPRFKIESVGDWYTTFDATARWRGRTLPRRETRIEGGVSADRFDHDTIVDREDYGLSLGQEITASRRNLLAGGLWVSHIPSYYLGELTDRDESVVAGTRVRNSVDYA